MINFEVVRAIHATRSSETNLDLLKYFNNSVTLKRMCHFERNSNSKLSVFLPYGSKTTFMAQTPKMFASSVVACYFFFQFDSSLCFFGSSVQ